MCLCVCMWCEWVLSCARFRGSHSGEVVGASASLTCSESKANTDVYFSKPRGCLQMASKEPGCLVQSHSTQLPAFPLGPWGPQTLEETSPSCFSSCWLLNGGKARSCTVHLPHSHTVQARVDPRAPLSCPESSVLGVEWVCLRFGREGGGLCPGLQALAG